MIPEQPELIAWDNQDPFVLEISIETAPGVPAVDFGVSQPALYFGAATVPGLSPLLSLPAGDARLTFTSATTLRAIIPVADLAAFPLDRTILVEAREVKGASWRRLGMVRMRLRKGVGPVTASTFTTITPVLAYKLTLLANEVSVADYGAAKGEPANPLDPAFSRVALNFGLVTLPWAPIIATDAALGNMFSLTLTGPGLMAFPTNLVVGGTYYWFIEQDATGGRTLTFDALFKWGERSPLVISAGAGTTNSFSAAWNGAKLCCSYARDFG